MFSRIGHNLAKQVGNQNDTRISNSGVSTEKNLYLVFFLQPAFHFSGVERQDGGLSQADSRREIWGGQ